MESEHDALEDRRSAPSDNGVREVFVALPALARIAWFAIGALVATTITLVAMLRPWARAPHAEAPLPFEIFPFADNAGVCQEWVALGSLQTTHEDAVAVVRRLTPMLPPTVRAENLRVVRAFALGDFWTIAVDAQSGAGDATRAGEVAQAMNQLPGTGLRFDPVFYSNRRLYETARVLCMPRQSVAGR